MGKSLVDSPALNAHSRAVLVPATTPRLPPLPVRVAGPGPSESHAGGSGSGGGTSSLPKAVADKPAPPTPTTQESQLIDDEEGEGEGDADEEDDNENNARQAPLAAMDPYANLDGAFGSVDRAGNENSARRGEDDDLLF